MHSRQTLARIILRTQTASTVSSQNSSFLYCWFDISFIFFFNIIFADLEECTTNTHNCDVNADCANTVGSYSCKCKAGYTGNGHTCNGKKQTNNQKKLKRIKQWIDFMLMLNVIECNNNPWNLSYVDGLTAKLYLEKLPLLSNPWLNT